VTDNDDDDEYTNNDLIALEYGHEERRNRADYAIAIQALQRKVI